MKGEMDRRMIYGNNNVTDVIKKKYELEALRKLKGRPKKEEQQKSTAVPFKNKGVSKNKGARATLLTE